MNDGARALGDEVGATAAREGRALDGLQDALRLGARVAWRCLCEAGAALRTLTIPREPR